MKVKLLFIVVSIVLAIVGCTTGYKTESKAYSKNLESGFVDGSKTLSLCRCLEYSREQELKLWEEDVDCRTPDYLYAQAKIIDSLAHAEAQRIKQAGVNRNYQRAEGMEGNKIMTSCLAFYNSKELDKIVKVRLKADIKSFNSIGEQ